jgi:hypothetical protein
VLARLSHGRSEADAVGELPDTQSCAPTARACCSSEESADKVVSSWKGSYGTVQHLVDSHKVAVLDSLATRIFAFISSLSQGNAKLQEAAIRSHAAKSAVEFDVVVVGLLYRCLTSHSFDTWAFG